MEHLEYNAAVNGAEVEIPGGLSGYAALPPAATRGVVVIHEIFGRQPEIDRVVDRFAAAGYAAVAPDLFAGRMRITCIVQAMRAIRSGSGQELDRIRDARTWLCAAAHIPVERVGLIGFCLGGGFALACGRGWAAISTNYGDVPPTQVMEGIGPVVGCYGGKDLVMGKNGATLQKRLRSLGVEPEIHVFPNVGHAFLTDGHHPVARVLGWPMRADARNDDDADEAWRRIFAFFDRHL
jgi:carboxymethylenebutenolidase